MATVGEKKEHQDLYTSRVLKSFMAFLKTDVARQIVDSKFIDRLVGEGSEIGTLNQLTRWVRERWPDHFHTDPRRATSRSYNKDVVAKLWAAYLQWKEEA